MKRLKVDELRISGLHLGEGEAIALYFQEKAQLLATDDDTCRKNRIILGIKIIGSPAIVIMLFKNAFREKLHSSVLSVYSVVEKLYSYSLFQEKLKSLKGQRELT
jgi:predicted nucleic acid-binding protein